MKTISKFIFVVSITVSFTAHAQTARPFVDMSCLAKSELACGNSYTYDMGNKGNTKGTGTSKLKLGGVASNSYSWNVSDQTGVCLSALLANPPAECVVKAYSAADIDAIIKGLKDQLAQQTKAQQDQETRSRARNIKLCRQFASAPETCETLIPPAEPGK